MGSFVFTASLGVQGPNGIIALTVHVTLVLLDSLIHQGRGNQEDTGGTEGHGQKGLPYWNADL